jgi:hypothetical protein
MIVGIGCLAQHRGPRGRARDRGGTRGAGRQARPYPIRRRRRAGSATPRICRLKRGTWPKSSTSPPSGMLAGPSLSRPRSKRQPRISWIFSSHLRRCPRCGPGSGPDPSQFGGSGVGLSGAATPYSFRRARNSCPETDPKWF